MLLGEIAIIKTGLVLARKKAEIELEVKAKYHLISLKNIEADGTLTSQSLEEFKSKDVLGKEHFTSEGDVLIRLSHPNTAICIGQEQEGLLIPSYFAKIQVQNVNVLPGYIAWYLNTDKVKGELLRHQTGTNIPSTNISVLEQLAIPEMDLEKQQVITEIQRLYHKEKALYLKLMKEKERLYTAVSNSIIGIK